MQVTTKTIRYKIPKRIRLYASVGEKIPMTELRPVARLVTRRQLKIRAMNGLIFLPGCRLLKRCTISQVP
jgi:hypothetical protein